MFLVFWVDLYSLGAPLRNPHIKKLRQAICPGGLKKLRARPLKPSEITSFALKKVKKRPEMLPRALRNYAKPLQLVRYYNGKSVKWWNDVYAW